MKSLRVRNLLFGAVFLLALVLGGVQPVDAAQTMTLADACGFVPDISQIDVLTLGGEGGAYTITNPAALDALEVAEGVSPGNVSGVPAAYMTVQGVTFAVYVYPDANKPYRVACENGTVLRTNDPFFRCWSAGECHLL